MKVLLHIDATAGWGKTTAIERDIKKYAEISSFWKTADALYLVFTKRNVESARKRLRGYVRKSNIRTLHSFFYSFMGARPVMDGNLLDRFGKKYGYGKLSSGMFFRPRNRGDYLLSFYYRARNRKVSLYEACNYYREELTKLGIGGYEIEDFIARWTAFKEEEGAVDYADILEIPRPFFWFKELEMRHIGLLLHTIGRNALKAPLDLLWIL
jgi:hypothetical protein